MIPLNELRENGIETGAPASPNLTPGNCTPLLHTWSFTGPYTGPDPA